MRFDTLMAKHHDTTEIDYLSIDVEGGHKILESIDFKTYRINLIGVEDNYPHTSGISAFLRKCRYKEIAHIGSDRFFERTNNL